MKFLLLLLLTPSCASMYPVTGAMIGGAAGSLGGPIGAGLGAGAGYAGGALLKTDSELTDAEDEIISLTDTVAALTSGDVDELVRLQLERTVEEERGFLDKTLEGLYTLLEIAAWITGLAILLPMIYIWWRKRQALPYYQAQAKLAEDVQVLKEKLPSETP
jgi:hypothetical protein